MRKRRAAALRPQTNRPQTITGQQQLLKQLSAEEESERQHKQSEARQRRIRRRLDEFERLNYRDAAGASASSTNTDAAALLLGGDAEEDEHEDTLLYSRPDGNSHVGQATGPSDSKAVSQQRKRHQADIKRLLANKRNIYVMIQEATDQLQLQPNSTTPNWASAASRLSANRAILTHKLCSICGYHGDIVCVRCSERYCSLQCGSTHDETRCERPLR